MNALFAVGLFDNPWIIALFVIVSALADWLSKRRQEKQPGLPPEHQRGTPARPANQPAAESNLEETLRRLMGEEPQMQTPPPMPRAAQREIPPALDSVGQSEEESVQPARQILPAVRPPPPAVAQTSIPTASSVEDEDEVATIRRFEQLNEQRIHPVAVLGHGRVNRSRSGRRASSRWRQPRNVRQAFVASLVFGQPKSLEP